MVRLKYCPSLSSSIWSDGIDTETKRNIEATTVSTSFEPYQISNNCHTVLTTAAATYLMAVFASWMASPYDSILISAWALLEYKIALGCNAIASVYFSAASAYLKLERRTFPFSFRSVAAVARVSTSLSQKKDISLTPDTGNGNWCLAVTFSAITEDKNAQLKWTAPETETEHDDQPSTLRSYGHDFFDENQLIFVVLTGHFSF